MDIESIRKFVSLLAESAIFINSIDKNPITPDNYAGYQRLRPALNDPANHNSPHGLKLISGSCGRKGRTHPGQQQDRCQSHKETVHCKKYQLVPRYLDTGQEGCLFIGTNGKNTAPDLRIPEYDAHHHTADEADNENQGNGPEQAEPVHGVKFPI